MADPAPAPAATPRDRVVAVPVRTPEHQCPSAGADRPEQAQAIAARRRSPPALGGGGQPQPAREVPPSAAYRRGWRDGVIGHLAREDSPLTPLCREDSRSFTWRMQTAEPRKRRNLRIRTA